MATQHEAAILSGAANAAALGQLMAEAIRDELISHPAWDLVEEYNPGSTMQWYVFKCLASQNNFTDDFYVVMGRAKSTGILYFAICEGYNAGTHVMSLFPTTNGTQTQSSTYAYDAKGRPPKTYTLTNALFSTGNDFPKYARIQPTGTGISYNMCTYDDGFYYCTYGGFSHHVYFGAYTWLGDQANDHPIMGAGNISDISGHCGITRNPLVASLTKGTWATTLTTRPLSSISSNEQLGYAGDADWKDAFHGGKTLAAEYMLFIDAALGQVPGSFPNAPENIGHLAGKMKYMRVMQGQPSMVFGDSFKLDGTLWIPDRFSLNSTFLIFDTGVPY